MILRSESCHINCYVCKFIVVLFSVFLMLFEERHHVFNVYLQHGSVEKSRFLFFTAQFLLKPAEGRRYALMEVLCLN